MVMHNNRAARRAGWIPAALLFMAFAAATPAEAPRTDGAPPSPRDPSPGATALQADARRLAELWEGSFDNSAEARRAAADSGTPAKDRPSERLYIYRRAPHPGLAGIGIYVQQHYLADGKQGPAYRQRLYEVYADPSRNEVVTRIYSFHPDDEARVLDAHLDPSKVAAIPRERLTALPPGCEIFWKRDGARFVGWQREGDCVMDFPRSSTKMLLADDLELTATSFTTHTRAKLLNGEPLMGDAAPLVMQRRPAETPPAAGAAAAAGASAAERRCRALASLDFADVTDAPTQVTASRLVAATANAPAHCEALGYVSPQVGFELRLPEEGWNGRFAQVGCGGFCGAIFAGACDGMLSRGYACIATDLGHKSTALDAKWAYNNLQAEVDFAYRATHVATLAGKAITARYYGRAHQKAYLLGCSTGGRQGMVSAQRFPWDYDGIVAGAPVINETGDGLALLWAVQATLGPDGRSILSHDDVRRVHAAAIARCDRDDGLADGVIGDPRTCRFDPAELACSTAGGATQGACLAPAQVEAVRRIYGGSVNSRGVRLYTGGAMPGSELNWLNNYIAADGGPSVYQRFMTDMFRFLNFMPDPGPSWTINSFDWDRDYRRLDLMESLYSGSNPDLRRFKAAGGKLIVWQGWADQSVLPLNTIDYYETAERTMGGRAATQEFFRLFMVPGMNHCIGGDGAHRIDYLSYIEDWVERGRAPDRLLAVKPRGEPGRGYLGVPMPAPADIEFSRPVFPYPIGTRYDGRGDPTSAASFLPVKPR
jgi:feruloyl esterase